MAYLIALFLRSSFIDLWEEEIEQRRGNAEELRAEWIYVTDRQRLASIVNFDRIDGETVSRPLLSGNAQFNNCGQLFF